MHTAILILIPFIAALIELFIPRRHGKKFAVAGSLVAFVVALVTFMNFPLTTGDYQYVTDIPWINSLGIHFKVGMDGISMLLVLLTTFLVPLIILSVVQSETRTPVFYSLILFMEFALIGVFVSLDGFLFYVFWELALIPIYFICLLWGGEHRVKVTLKFFIYTLAGSLFMLVGLVYLYMHTTDGTFDIASLHKAGRSLNATEQVYLFIFFFLAFGIKMPVFPLHTWQPDTYTEAPTQGTMLLSGIMLKMGIYGVIRWMLPVLPLGIDACSKYVMWLAIIGVIYASIIAITRSDIKRLIAYSSIAHVGLIAAGIFFIRTESGVNINGVQGAIIQMLSHGINVVGLFFIVDIIQRRTETRKIASLGGIRQKAPFFATAFIILTLGAVALPLTDGFVGEFMLINSIYMFKPIMAVLGGLTIILGAVYMLRMYQRVVLGETSAESEKFFDLTPNEKAVLIPLLIMVIVIGIWPNIFLKVSEPAVRKLLSGF